MNRRNVETRLLDREIPYTGRELSPGWIAGAADLRTPDALAAFVGPCRVAPEFMVDLEDLRGGHSIRGDKMLHFIAEHAAMDLETVTLSQRLLMFLIFEHLAVRCRVSGLTRRGSDLYGPQGKLSISVATTGPSSGLIHAAVNIVSTGAPVPVTSLSDLAVEARPMALCVFDRYREEWGSVSASCAKVKILR